MKNWISLVWLLLCSSQIGWAQDSDTTIYNFVDTIPLFKHSKIEYHKTEYASLVSFTKLMKEDQAFYKLNENGRSIVFVIVEKDGSISHLDFPRSKTEKTKFDLLVERTLKKLGKFDTPAIKDNKPVRYRYLLCFKFSF